MLDAEILESNWLIGWGFVGCGLLVDVGLAVAAPQSLPWFALWRGSDR